MRKLRELACALRLRACLFLSVAVVPLAYLRSGLSVRQWCKVRILGFACLDPGDRGAGTDIDAPQRPGYALFVCKSLGRAKDRAQDFRQAVLLMIAQQELAPPDEPASDVVPRSKRRPGRPSKKRVARDFAGRLAASLRALTCHVRSLWYRPHMPAWARDAFPRAAGEAGMCEGRDGAPLPALAGSPVEVADSPGSEDVVIEIAESDSQDATATPPVDVSSDSSDATSVPSREPAEAASSSGGPGRPEPAFMAQLWDLDLSVLASVPLRA